MKDISEDFKHPIMQASSTTYPWVAQQMELLCYLDYNECRALDTCCEHAYVKFYSEAVIDLLWSTVYCRNIIMKPDHCRSTELWSTLEALSLQLSATEITAPWSGTKFRINLQQKLNNRYKSSIERSTQMPATSVCKYRNMKYKV